MRPLLDRWEGCSGCIPTAPFPTYKIYSPRQSSRAHDCYHFTACLLNRARMHQHASRRRQRLRGMSRASSPPLPLDTGKLSIGMTYSSSPERGGGEFPATWARGRLIDPPAVICSFIPHASDSLLSISSTLLQLPLTTSTERHSLSSGS
jgi:hypothetical protein